MIRLTTHYLATRIWRRDKANVWRFCPSCSFFAGEAVLPFRRLPVRRLGLDDVAAVRLVAQISDYGAD